MPFESKMRWSSLRFVSRLGEDQRPVDRRPARQRPDDRPGSGPTPCCSSCQQIREGPHAGCARRIPSTPGLDRRRHLMRAGARPRRLIRQPRRPAAAGIAAQPLMDRLPRDAIPAGHIGGPHRSPTRPRPGLPAPPGTAALPHPASPAHPAPSAATSPLIAGKRPGRLKAGNHHGVSPTYRNYCRLPTRTASATCRPGAGTKVSSIYRDRTHRRATRPQIQTTPTQMRVRGVLDVLRHHRVELRGFEPLTPSMRKAYCAFGYHW